MFDAVGWAYTAAIENVGAKFVLVVLAEHGGNADANEDWHCWPSIETICDFTGHGYRTVQRHLQWLETEGWITMERRRRPDGTLSGYTFTLHRARNSDHGPRPQRMQRKSNPKRAPRRGAELASGQTGATTGGQNGHAEVLFPEGSLEGSSLRSESCGEPHRPVDPDLADDAYGDEDEVAEAEFADLPLAPGARTEVTALTVVEPDDDRPAFERFWDAYPRHTAKGNARTAFGKVVKRGQATEDWLIARARDFAAAVSHWPEEARSRFIPHAATWLNQGRWDDDMDEVRLQHRPDGRRQTALGAMASTLMDLRREDGSDDAGPAADDDCRF